jgi:L-threonylcarbamoyladenylate synthase
MAMEEIVQQAVKVFNQGGIVIFPTDTAFGIGCRIDNEESIKRLFEIRKRPQTQATPVLVDGLVMAQAFLQPISQEVIEKLIKPFWPGALTIVLPSKIEKVPDLARGGGDTLGVRMPNHSTALEIIKQVGVPILGPSANLHGEKTPYEFKDLDNELIKLVDFVVEGECQTKQTSTVIDCAVHPWKILRQGAIRIEL